MLKLPAMFWIKCTAAVNRVLPRGECILCLDPADRFRLCSACIRELPRIYPSQRTTFLPLGKRYRRLPIYSLFLYQWPVTAMQLRFKYSKDFDTGQALAGVFAQEFIQEDAPRYTWQIVPTPMYWKRRWQRSFNHALLQAQPLAKYGDYACTPQLLSRNRNTPAQVGLSRKERLRNLRGAFTCGEVKGKNILLFDDVITTGSTMQEMARMIYQAGAKEVRAVSIARVE